MTKEEVYLDLSKLSDVEQKKVIEMLPEPVEDIDYEIDNFYYLLHFETNKWFVDCVDGFKKEITYEEFKTLINE